MPMYNSPSSEYQRQWPALRELLLDFFARLDDASVTYCILRNYGGLPDCMGNDIDLLVAPRDISVLESCLLSAAEETGWLILKRPRRYGYRSYWFRSPDERFMHFDAWSKLFWKGLRWADEEVVLRRRRRRKQFYVMNPADEAASLLVKGVLQNTIIKEKYQNQIVYAVRQHPTEFRRFLKWAMGESLAADIIDHIAAENWEGVLRQRNRMFGRLFLTGFARNPFEPLLGIGRFLLSHLSVMLTAHNGVFVTFTGPDGSGKSTVADELTNYLAQLLPQSRYYHGRFGFLPDLRLFLNIARWLCGHRPLPPAPSGVNAVHDTPAHGTFRCVVHTLYYSLDFVCGYFPLARINAIGNLVIFDRYFYDWFIQTHFKKTPKLLLPILKVTLPQPDLVVFLSNSPEVIHRRKPELTVEQIAEQSQKCRQIIRNMPYAMTVSTDQPPNEVAREISDHIVQIMTNRFQA